MADAYPLSWPAGWKRTAPSDRLRPRFHGTVMRSYTHDPSRSYRDKKDLSVFEAVDRVRKSLVRLGVEEHTVVISTNIELRRDGLPRSDRRSPEDPGVAVYWRQPGSGQPQCMAIDLYSDVAGNLAAIAASIEALRAIERHGGAQILNRAFAGFNALPATTTTTMGAETAAEVIARRAGQPYTGKNIVGDHLSARHAVRRAQSSAHPDAGGTTEDFQLVQEAKRVLESHFGASL